MSVFQILVSYNLFLEVNFSCAFICFVAIISQLKAQIFELKGFPVHRQSIVYAGKKLDDNTVVR
jgi:hypothetical protein